MSHNEEIINVLNAIAVDSKESTWTDAAWTKEIKNRLSGLGHEKKFLVYASSASGVDGGEWLYDLTWLNYSNKNLIDVELVLESEWTFNNIDDDFQKLLLAKSELRVLIFQAKDKLLADKKIVDLKRQISRFTKSFSGDQYLLSCWVYGSGEFFHTEYTHK